MITGYRDKHEFISESGVRSVVYLMDCEEGMKQFPDKYFELAIVDPPYGIDRNGMNMGNSVFIKLYSWLLHNYAKQGDKILDTHLGSGSSRIAAHKAGFDFTGFETDEDYFREGNKRFNNHVKQLPLL